MRLTFESWTELGRLLFPVWVYLVLHGGPKKNNKAD